MDKIFVRKAGEVINASLAKEIIESIEWGKRIDLRGNFDGYTDTVVNFKEGVVVKVVGGEGADTAYVVESPNHPAITAYQISEPLACDRNRLIFEKPIL